VKDARFRVKHSPTNPHWIICLPTNQKATDIIHGRKAALRPAYPPERTESFYEWAQKHTTHHDKKLEPDYYEKWLVKNNLKGN